MERSCNEDAVTRKAHSELEEEEAREVKSIQAKVKEDCRRMNQQKMKDSFMNIYDQYRRAERCFRD